MTGISRHTGQPISNLDSAFQGVEVALSTLLGSRVMRREFGGGVLELLGRLVRPSLFDAFRQLVATTIDLWEPRFSVRKVSLTGTVDGLRTGAAGLKIEVNYRPRGHLGDFTVEGVRSFSVLFFSSNVRVE